MRVLVGFLVLMSASIFSGFLSASTYEVSVHVKTNDGVDLSFPKTKVRTGESVSANKVQNGRKLFLELAAAETDQNAAGQSLPPNVPLRLSFSLGEYGPKGETLWMNHPQLVLKENEEAHLTTDRSNGAPQVTVTARAQRLQN